MIMWFSSPLTKSNASAVVKSRHLVRTCPSKQEDDNRLADTEGVANVTVQPAGEASAEADSAVARVSDPDGAQRAGTSKDDVVSVEEEIEIEQDVVNEEDRGVKCNIVLTQQDSILLQPGRSFTLTCKVSGYSVTDDNYATAWIRQPAGKALEWITHIWGGGTVRKTESLANTFSISKSDSSSTVTLQAQSLQSEDTAVYYCARQPQHKHCT
ncbi:uncharacterized protein LOC127652937 [Xyrauchen texanus]|uniref:uncharacterized protein LOC127652937 n=1 Tax=Xyrauchen texanus TaxID=154827 RepID=UPI002241F863|nr:uncharacterized protein LOC127652937 [Xyrauchen texanus]